jgi:large subunit ribosomal protein L21
MSKFAIVATGGKQYKVSVNDVITVEKLEITEGQKIILKAIAVFGEDLKVESFGGEVEAEFVAHEKDKKKIIFKKERRTTHKKKTGHRQKLTTIKILGIKKA